MQDSTIESRYIHAFFIAPCPSALRHGSHSFTCQLHHACLYFFLKCLLYGATPDGGRQSVIGLLKRMTNRSC